MKNVLLTSSMLFSVSCLLTDGSTFIVDFRDSGTSDIPNANTVDPTTSGSNQPVSFFSGTNILSTDGLDQLTLDNFNVSAAPSGTILGFNRQLNLPSVINTGDLPSWATESAARSAPSVLGPSGSLTTLNFEVSGFQPNQDQITVSFISSWLNDAGGGNVWNMTINGTFSDGNGSQNFNGYTNGRNALSFADLDWSNLTADAGGTLNFSFTTTDRRISLNAMEISVIPEPGTYALFAGAFSLLGLVIYRRLKPSRK